MAEFHSFRQQFEVFSPPFGDCIGKGDRLAEDQGCVLYFDIGITARPSAEQHIEAGRREVRHLKSGFSLDPIVAVELRDRARGNGRCNEVIYPSGVDSDPTLSHIDPFEGPGQFSLGVVAVAELYRCAGLPACLHRSRIWAVCRDDASIRQTNVRQKTLIALQHYAVGQRGQLVHEPSNSTDRK